MEATVSVYPQDLGLHPSYNPSYPLISYRHSGQTECAALLIVRCAKTFVQSGVVKELLDYGLPGELISSFMFSEAELVYLEKLLVRVNIPHYWSSANAKMLVQLGLALLNYCERHPDEGARIKISTEDRAAIVRTIELIKLHLSDEVQTELELMDR